MNILLFLVTLGISFVMVRIGAVALQMTGLEWAVAKFQALSCFSGTGFTTKESELIVSHPQRRTIASILIIAGNVGLVTLIATFANTLRPVNILTNVNIAPPATFVPAKLVPLLNLFILVLFTYIVIRIFNSRRMMDLVTKISKKFIRKKKILRRISFVNLAMLGKDHSIAQVTVAKGSEVIDKTINKSGLKEKGILILAIDSQGKTIYNPPANTVIRHYDKLTCFGVVEDIKEAI